MAQNSSIEWTNATWNPTVGCSKSAPGCANCYAVKEVHRMAGNPNPKIRAANEGLTERMPNGKLNWTGIVRAVPDRLGIPLHNTKPTKYFVNSLSDLFHPLVPPEFIAAVFGVMALTPWHTYQILTKYPSRAAELLTQECGPNVQIPSLQMAAIAWISDKVRFTGDDDGRAYVRSLNRVSAWLAKHGSDGEGFVPFWPLHNVWIGTSISTQNDADANVQHLLRIPAAVRFLSVEPLLGHIDLSMWLTSPQECIYIDHKPTNGPDWVIVGGESGHGARPCDVVWIRSIVKQCVAAGVPPFVKQLGANVIDRNDAGFEGDLEIWADGPNVGEWSNPSAWPHQHAAEDRIEHLEPSNYQGAPVRIHLRDRKGGNWDEWPMDLRIRQFPSEAPR